MERAAALLNTMVSGFVTSNALEAAARAIREHERIVLSDRDWELFFGGLVDPSGPNTALREAFATHERMIAKPPACDLRRRGAGAVASPMASVARLPTESGTL